MFQGASSLSLDAKGRLSVPTRHRDALSAAASQLTITKHPHGCLMIFPRTAWEQFRDWARGYDDPTFTGRSRAGHEAWLGSLEKPLLRLDSARPTAQLVDAVLAWEPR